MTRTLKGLANGRHRLGRHRLHGHDPLSGRRQGRRALASSPCAVAIPRSLPATGRASRAISALAALRWILPASPCYRDFDALLADPNVDLVDLCVPNDAHGRMAIQALQAGKNVLVEKPIALNLAEADSMLAAAAAAGKQLLVGHVLPFFPEFAFALEAVQSGRYGALARGSSDARDLKARLVE